MRKFKRLVKISKRAEGMKGFKQFILRGNVIDLAVGIVIGAAFDDVVSTFVASFLTPLIAAFGGAEQFSELYFAVNGIQIRYGDFLNATISFLILAFVIYFLVVLPMNTLEESVKTGESPDPTTHKCPYCFTEISKKAIRCPHCTSDLSKKRK